MSLAFLFWIAYVIGLILYLSRNYNDRVYITNNFMYWILILLLGIGTFGSPIK